MKNVQQINIEFYGDCKIPIFFVLTEDYTEPSILKLNDHLLVINADYFGVPLFNQLELGQEVFLKHLSDTDTL